MIRIHFGADDVRRITFITESDPLCDSALAARALGCGMVPPWAHRWARQARPRLQPAMRPLLSLVRPRGFPNFLTPELPEGGLESAISVLMDTPTDVLRAELEPAAGDDWVRDLAAGRARARRDLTEAIRAFHDAVLRPWSATTNLRLAADLARRSRVQLRGGVDELLGTLHPDVDWSAPVLTTYAAKPPGSDLDVRLGGRGLRLYPSQLISHCVVLDQPGRTPVLAYPMLTSCDVSGSRLDPDENEPDPLTDLLGRTRGRGAAYGLGQR